MTRIFVLASEELKKECIEKAQRWNNEPNQKMFVDGRTGFITAVAEYIANEKGFTLYECNATYPRK